jgi:tRNA-specific 2-thiouridylase
MFHILLKIVGNFKIIAKLMKSTGKKAFVGMSGGVDSSVAAYLLKQDGYDVTGVFLRSYNLDGCAERDAEDARRVAEHIGIPFYVWDTEEDYKKKVVDYMVRGYAKGETPNPDVMCNKEIKFGIFYEKALAMGADYVATGHYVRVRRHSLSRTAVRSLRRRAPAALSAENPPMAEPSFSASESFSQENLGAPFSLLEGADKNKDQSYFLWTLTQRQLAHCLFPIGKYKKPDVREIARQAGLPTAEKKDSQGICFLGRISLEDFLRSYIKPRPGEVVTVGGKHIGEHTGAEFYTIGQRHGLNLGMKNKELGIKGRTATKPYYVAEKDIATNTIVVAEGDNNPALYRKEIEITDVNFISPKNLSLIRANKSLDVLARVRYRQPLIPAKLMTSDLEQMATDANPRKPFKKSAVIYKLVFAEPIKFVARGQSAVFYSRRGEILGGGVIV